MKKRFKAKIYEAEERQLEGVDISCNIIDDVKAPKWFTEFVETRFDPLARDVAILRVDVDDLKVRMTNVENRLTKLETRFDNLVTKNNLKE